MEVNPAGRVRRLRGRKRDETGVDPQILGIDSDGHVAFNEPGSSLGSRTRMMTLTSQTRMDNARVLGGDVDAVPPHCLTPGLAKLVDNPVGALRPAIQHHPHVSVLLDEAASRRLQLAAYYRETYRSKPEWQGI